MRTPPRARVAALLLLLLFCVQAGIGALRDSVTIDEFANLPLGLHLLRTGDLELDPINPPLVRALAATPVLLGGAELEAADAELGTWGLGYAFLERNRGRYHALFLRARLVMVGLAVLLGLVVFLWARDLAGWPAGLAALGLFAFSPTALAHGHLVAFDLPGALGFSAALYALWTLLEKPSPRHACLLGVALGLATLLKLSGLVLPLLVIGLLGLRALDPREPSSPGAARWLGLLVVAGGVALLVLNLGYGFDGTLAPLGLARLDPRGGLSEIQQALPWLRLPVPLRFLEGADMALQWGRDREASYFLMGELSSEGWWYYHLAAFLFKTPLPLVIAALAATGLWVTSRFPGRRAYCVFLPILAVFASNALLNPLQIGVRHVLPVYPLVFVAAGVLVASGLRPAAGGFEPAARRAAVALGLVWYVAGSLAVAPRYLQYFNELAGGPTRGHELLIDSNLDWGQDLIRLREYMEAKGLDEVTLAYFGRVDPRAYGVRFRPRHGPRARGPVVVSASFLMGRPYFWYWRGEWQWVPANTYAWLRRFEPVERVGSLFVFDLPAPRRPGVRPPPGTGRREDPAAPRAASPPGRRPSSPR
jgi:hypothetical protein